MLYYSQEREKEGNKTVISIDAIKKLEENGGLTLKGGEEKLLIKPAGKLQIMGNRLITRKML